MTPQQGAAADQVRGVEGSGRAPTAAAPCSGATAGTWIPFTGTRTGVLTWRAQHAGVRLTFQATVVAAGRSLKLRAPVQVKLP